MSNIKIFITFLTITLVFLTKTTEAKTDNAYIESFAKNYLIENIASPPNGKLTIKVANIDPRVEFDDCETNLNANIPQNFNGRNVNIKISCDDSTPWHIYLAAKINTMIPVIVAKKSINKGTLLDKSHVKLAYKDSYKIRGTFLTDLNKVIGTKSERRVSKGQLLTLRNICIVCEGSQVAIIAQSENFTIKTNGEALSSGNIGEQISVKNKQSGKIITAQVKAINKVVINL